MSDEIARLRKVLDGPEDDVLWADRHAALRQLWPAMLAVCENDPRPPMYEAAVLTPIWVDAYRWTRMCAAFDALNTAIREHLGSES